MKKKALTTAVLAGIGGAAGLAGIANAVNINNDGLGQVLIYPYYTVNAGNQTLMSIVNTTNRVKAVKVRFLEGLNSRECLDFNLYLSPFDVWTASIFALDDTGPANLVTRDTSTTVPDIIGQTGPPPAGLAPNLPMLPTGDRYVPFREFALNDPNWPDANGLHDDGLADLRRCREGHIEAIEMAEINNNVEDSADAATHAPPGTFPADALQLNQAWVVDEFNTPIGYWAIDQLVDTDPATGGLFGAASLVDGAEGTQVSYDADAVAAFWDPQAAPQHTPPGSTQPSVASANFDSDGDFSVNSLVFDSDAGSVISSDWAVGVDAVSAVFMRNQIYNEYALDSDLDASTEWVLTFPTKRFYTDPQIVGTSARAPFTDVFDWPVGACEEFGLRFWDREELTTTPGIIPIDFSPPRDPGDPTRLFLCWETNVIRFVNDDQGLGGSPLFGIHTVSDGAGGDKLITFTLDGVFENGWARIDFTADSNGNPLALPHSYTSDDLDVYNGLPVTGFAAQVIKNGNVGGALANYAGLFRHKADKDIIGS